jgi:hypothetical protein
MADVSHRNYTPPDDEECECPAEQEQVYSSLAFTAAMADAAWLEPIAVTGPGGLLFYEKETLKDAGWTVLGSGDGVAAYGAAGLLDIITLPGSGANGFNNAGAWVCLERPDGQAALMLKLVTTDRGTGAAVSQAQIVYSRDNLFSFASASATVAPTASDGQYIKGGGGGHKVCDWLSGSGTNYVFGGADTAAPYGFWFHAVDNGTTASTYGGKHFFMYSPLLAADDDDTDQYVWSCRGDDDAGNTMQLDDGTFGDTKYTRGYTPDGASWVGISGLAYEGLNEVFPRDTTGPTSPFLNAAHVLFASSTTVFNIKGWSSICAYVGENYSSSGVPGNDEKRVVYNHPEGGTANLIRVMGCVLPWNGTVPAFAGNTWTNAGTLKIWTLELARALVTLEDA